jgi:hypothetical protein
MCSGFYFIPQIYEKLVGGELFDLVDARRKASGFFDEPTVAM